MIMAGGKNQKDMPKDYNIVKEIQKDKLYKSNVKVRDDKARKILEDETSMVSNNKYIEGNLYMFNYFTPKTQEELKYYDAMPVAILFGSFKTKSGENRILGFNIHYYPPRIRYQIMNKIIEVFKGVYKKNWGEPLKTPITKFTYYSLIRNLQQAKLEFGVREYDPQLMGKVHPIPVSLWHKAVFTEGHFKKQTREAILNHWKQLKEDKQLLKRAQSRP